MQPRPARFPADRSAILRLIEAVTTVDGVDPLGEPALADLSTGPADTSFGFVVGDERPIGYVHGLGRSGELAVDPRYRTAEVVQALVDALSARDQSVGVWTHTDDVAELVATVDGWYLDRVLSRMVAPLPPAERPDLPPGVSVRGFRAGEDEPAWLDLNNSAFEGHPEQGGWDLADLERRMGWDWFDPEGLRMAWESDRLVAFNWTKMHEDGTGEIFVIATDEAARGRGLGRAVALDGLWDLWSRRGAYRAALFVDGSNAAAVSLYEDLGFTTTQTHRYYRWAA
jgi:mycothiol synthase